MGLKNSLILFIFSISLYSMEQIHLQKNVWDSLSEAEKRYIEKKYIISTFENLKEYGKVLDVQILNKSYYNNGSMQKLGSSFAQLKYLENNFFNYSAEKHLDIALLGGIVGGLLDKPTEHSYHFRYTIELLDKSIIIKNVYLKEPFYISKGLCIKPETLKLVSNNFCEESSTSLTRFKEKFNLNNKKIEIEKIVIKDIEKNRAKVENVTTSVKCKLGTSGIIRTSLKKCNLVKGIVIN